MDSALVESIKLVGGIAGLATAGFTLWDRAFRARSWVEPHIAISPIARPVGVPMVDGPICLRIHNPGSRTIGIGAVQFRGVREGSMALSDDVGRNAHPRRLLPIGPGEMRVFEMTWVDQEPGEAPERPIWITVSWRPLTALLPSPPLRLRTSIGTLTRLQEAEIDRVQRQR
ncbi:hypothetical protein MPPM_3851 [Methylorubrum populi]|uniref:Uncharacterized protein n=1 Tax=Methylorubrum populi TaxID=223967 RepID=A0A160PHV4_9HYPH|nr:hypothetical protein [Methylorubrum populi]BAU92456.1 hypothetical protein MPPM_3851 [Methylorubrum populi]